MSLYKLNFGDISTLESETIVREFTTSTNLIINIELFYNNIDGYIYMNVRDEDDEDISLGIKLVQQIDLFENILYLFDVGVGMVILPESDSFENDEVTIDNLGESLEMYFYEESI